MEGLNFGKGGNYVGELDFRGPRLIEFELKIEGQGGVKGPLGGPKKSGGGGPKNVGNKKI